MLDKEVWVTASQFEKQCLSFLSVPEVTLKRQCSPYDGRIKGRMCEAESGGENYLTDPI